MKKNIKILAITNVAVPYRVDFFNELSKYADVTVVYEQSIQQQTHREAVWFTDKKVNYKVVSIVNGKGRISYKTLFHVLNENKNSIILMMGYSKPGARAAIIWLKLHRIPYVLTCDGGFIREESGIKKSIKRYLISGASLYLSTAKATDVFFQYYGAEAGRIARIPFTSLFKKDILEVPISLTDKKRIREELHITEEKVIISVGQFIYRKGYDVLLEACNYLDRIYGIYIIGSEPSEEYLELKEKYNLYNVHFVGFKGKEELKKYYMSGDLFVLPTREDVWGLVINEAMANGLPVISTERCIAGIELISNGNNGFIVPVDDAETLGERIRDCFEKYDHALMAASSLEKIKDYTIERMAKQYYDLFTELVNEEKTYD